ncbi:MAG: 2-oxoacid:acceptor oxidoreductase subunit alpha [Bacteroidota bacterium]
MAKTVEKIVEKDSVVVKFVGDSGDGMQLSGTLFSDSAALSGYDLANFPDYPAEIRPPLNTIAGVSGFQVHFGSKEIFSSGDLCDVMVNLNPASLKASLKWAMPGTVIFTDADGYDEKTMEKVGFTSNPLEDKALKQKYRLIGAPITTLTRESLKDFGMDNKAMDKCRNMFALGMVYCLLNQSLDHTNQLFIAKFKKAPKFIEINTAVLKAGYDYAMQLDEINPRIEVKPAKMPKGRYRNITGNVAAAWGLLAASERSKRPLFLGSYPITPATEILIELAKHKSLGAKVFQAEDEIAGICSAIGASFTGSLACTTTSGPGLSLKSEAIGLAVITELPLVIVNVQRGGPSTGLPTKSEQSDLYQALFGRNGECPVVVLAASTPSDCFYFAYEAAKIAMEHMTPVILLTDGYIGQGSKLLKIPKTADLPSIVPPIALPNEANYKPYRRDEKTLARRWAIPGTEGLRHRIGGLEKSNIDGIVTTDPENHQLMVDLRAEKVERVANYLPEQTIFGAAKGDLLVVSWGGTFGAVRMAVEEMQKQGKKVSHAHFNYIMPLPKNTEKLFKGFGKTVVCELNSGQFVNFLRMKFPKHDMLQYNKVQGLPFTVTELTDALNKIVKEK